MSNFRYSEVGVGRLFQTFIVSIKAWLVKAISSALLSCH